MNTEDTELFTEDCPKCNGEGWLWREELDYPNIDVYDCNIDDTRYTCDHCHGNFRKVQLSFNFK